MAVLALLEDNANGRTVVPWLLWFFGSWWWLTYQPIQICKSYPLGNLYCVGPGFGEADGEESHIASSHTSPDYSWFSSNRIVPEGMGWPVRNESGSSEPRHSGCFKRDHPHLSQVYTVSIWCRNPSKHLSAICRDRRFSQCNRSDRLHTHCNKGAIWGICIRK